MAVDAIQLIPQGTKVIYGYYDNWIDNSGFKQKTLVHGKSINGTFIAFTPDFSMAVILNKDGKVYRKELELVTFVFEKEGVLK